MRVLVFALLAANVLNLAYIFWRTGTLRILGLAGDVFYSYRGHDFPRVLPLPYERGRVLWTTEETVHYTPLGDASSDQWLTLTTAGGSYVHLGPADRAFVPTMFHEVHCLWTLNRGFSKGKIAVPMAHVNHCANYLRLGMTCQPDLTLEPGTYFETRDFEREPFGGTHECADWDEIYRVADENFLEWNNRTGWNPNYNPYSSETM